jgi:uncharacterized protein YgbK (DUF1537 family)
MTQLAIIADDLTGAADTGACFADAGLATVVHLTGTPIPDADVVVLTTESRDLDANAAAEAVRSVIGNLVGGQDDPGARWYYKKIDSALRGHLRDELLALMATIGETRTVVAPAFPGEGRTTVGGHQYIAGVLLESSLFGGPGADSDLLALFAGRGGTSVRLIDLAVVRGQPEILRRLLTDGPDGIVVVDAETDDDLLALAHVASGSGMRLFCGTAGFARQLAHSLPLIAAAPPLPKPVHGDGPILIVAGSQHEATARQIEALREAGMPIVRPAQELIDEPENDIGATVGEVATHLAARRSTVLTTIGMAPCSRGGHTVAARLAQVAAAADVISRVGGLVLTGGDVAAAVCTALGASALWLGGEISPGLPWGVLDGGRLHARPIATKAGSFGDDDALLACVDHLTRVIVP